MKLILHYPATFFSSEPEIKVLDENKNLFFYHHNREQKINFNLPEGIYYTSNSLEKRKFTPYEKLLPTGLNKSVLSEFKIIVAKNPNKATINPANKTVTIDTETAGIKYQPLQVFLIGHEIKHIEVGGDIYDSGGNKIYDAEKVCDAFATNYMLATGYNPSQIDASKELLLSSADRRSCIGKLTSKTNFRR